VREQRKLRLDEPVGQYVGGLHPRVAETTIAQLSPACSSPKSDRRQTNFPSRTSMIDRWCFRAKDEAARAEQKAALRGSAREGGAPRSSFGTNCTGFDRLNRRHP
jgi:hypothetical protein